MEENQEMLQAFGQFLQQWQSDAEKKKKEKAAIGLQSKLRDPKIELKAEEKSLLHKMLGGKGAFS